MVRGYAYGVPTLWSDLIGKDVLTCQEQNCNGNTLSAGACEFGTGWAVLNNRGKGSQGKVLSSG
jgi:hypothetical protein